MQVTPGDTTEERAEYWVEIIEQARRFPGGITAFCKQNGISKDNYYQWFKKLRFEHPEWEDLTNNAVHRAKRVKAKQKNKRKEAPVEVEPRPNRRQFTAAYKAKILKETDAAPKGEIAAILRREGLFWSTLRKWRTQMNSAGLEPQKRGRKADPQAEKIKKLENQLAKLEKRLKQKDILLELQKKIAEILETTNED